MKGFVQGGKKFLVREKKMWSEQVVELVLERNTEVCET